MGCPRVPRSSAGPFGSDRVLDRVDEPGDTSDDSAIARTNASCAFAVRVRNLGTVGPALPIEGPQEDQATFDCGESLEEDCGIQLIHEHEEVGLLHQGRRQQSRAMRFKRQAELRSDLQCVRMCSHPIDRGNPRRPDTIARQAAARKLRP